MLDRFRTLYFYNTQYEGGVCDHNVFCTGTTPSQTVSHIVDYALKNWGKKAYIIAADYNYGHVTAAWMTKFMQDGGGSAVATDYSRWMSPISFRPSAAFSRPSRTSCCPPWSARTMPDSTVSGMPPA